MLTFGGGFEVSMVNGMEEIEYVCSPPSGQTNATYPIFDRSPNIARGMGIEKDQAISKHAGKLHHAQMDCTLPIPPTSTKDYKILPGQETILIVLAGPSRLEH